MCNQHKGHGHLPKGVTRRDILRAGTAAAGIVALGPLAGGIKVAHGAPLNIKRMIVVNFFGGQDTLNFVIPHLLPRYNNRRPTIAINNGLSLDNGGAATNIDFTIHPVMTDIRNMWDDGDMAFVNKVGYPQQNLSHFTSQNIFSRGVRSESDGAVRSGWIARWADENAPTALSSVGIGVGRLLDFVGGQTSPFLASSLSNFEVRGRGGGNGLNDDDLHRVNTAKSMLAQFGGTGVSAEAKTAVDQAYQLADQVADSITNYSGTGDYGSSTFANRMKDISRMVEAGFETQIYYTGFGGLDTHGGQLNRHSPILANFNNAVRGFSQDMKSLGQWDNTVIVGITEFGRRNFENGSQGTDHGHESTQMIIGGPVQGGNRGGALVDNDLATNWLQNSSESSDFRSVYKEILTDHLGSGGMNVVFPEVIPGDQDLGLI